MPTRMNKYLKCYFQLLIVYFGQVICEPQDRPRELVNRYNGNQESIEDDVYEQITRKNKLAQTSKRKQKKQALNLKVQSSITQQSTKQETNTLVK